MAVALRWWLLLLMPLLLLRGGGRAKRDWVGRHERALCFGRAFYLTMFPSSVVVS
jgi:hypothetical protein